MHKIVVTGAAGFIGSHVAEYFANNGHHVVGVDCYTDYYSKSLKERNTQKIQKSGVIMHNLDLQNDNLFSVLDGSEYIFHLAGQPGISSTTPFKNYVRNNIMATHRLLENCQELQALKCFINISTSSVYGKNATGDEEVAPKPASIYGVTKLAAEQLVLSYHREQEFPACSLRIFSVYGPRERPDKLFYKVISSIINKTTFSMYEGSENHIRSYTNIHDIVSGFNSILNRTENAIGEIFNLGSEIGTTTSQAIRIIEKIMDKKVIIEKKPRRFGDQQKTCANINKAKNILNYEPKIKLEEGLKEQIRWFGEYQD